jgi:hypothetical protein
MTLSLITSTLMTGMNEVIRQLEQQKLAIERALDALRGIQETPQSPLRRGPGRPPKAAAPERGISEAGRQRLSDAMKRRWAAKRAGKAVKKAAAKKMSRKAA